MIYSVLYGYLKIMLLTLNLDVHALHYEPIYCVCALIGFKGVFNQ